MIETLLADLDSRIDPAGEKQLLDEWIDFHEGGFSGYDLRPMRNHLAPPRGDWPKVTVNQALEAPEAVAPGCDEPETPRDDCACQ